MSLKPIKGRPGKFLDSSSKQVIDISEFREDDKYDTIVRAAGSPTAGETHHFFRDVQNKNPIDTNFTQQSRLSAGEEMIVDRVGVTVRNAIGQILPTPSDIKQMAENAHLQVTVNNLVLSEGPLIKYPSGYGLAGNSVENGQGIVSLGVPSTAAAAKLLKTQLLTANHEVLGILRFNNRDWTGGAVAAADRMPTFTVAVPVTVWLHGLLKVAASK